MIRKYFLRFIGIVLLIAPVPVFSGEQETKALKAYLDALTSGDLRKVDSLLAPEFEYQYYRNGKLNKLYRTDELKSLAKLFNDSAGNAFNEIERFNRLYSRKYNLQFVIIFEDSPKVSTDSLFRGAVLDIDEKLNIVVSNNRIVRMHEASDKSSKDKLTFGFLKSLHLGNIDSDSVELGNELIIRLFEAQSRETLLMKKVIDVNHDHMVEKYLWPSNREISNFE